MVDQVLNFKIMHMKCDNLNFLLLSINLSYSVGWGDRIWGGIF